MKTKFRVKTEKRKRGPGSKFYELIRLCVYGWS